MAAGWNVASERGGGLAGETGPERALEVENSLSVYRLVALLDQAKQSFNTWQLATGLLALHRILVEGFRLSNRRADSSQKETPPRQY
jgi:hypothetical protein